MECPGLAELTSPRLLQGITTLARIPGSQRNLDKTKKTQHRQKTSTTAYQIPTMSQTAQDSASASTNGTPAKASADEIGFQFVSQY